MKKFSLIFFFLFLGLNLFNCSKEEFTEELKYNEPGCYNPWGTTTDINKIKAFLKTKDINPIKIYRKYIYAPDTNLCMSCFCPTGNAIFITILPKDEKKALDIGFSKYI